MRRKIFLTFFLGVLLTSSPTVAEDGFVSLFNGTDLTGWTVKGGDATFHVEDGNIVGVVNDARRNTFLCTEQEFENFIFKAEFKFDINFNSGIQFRSNARPEGDRLRVYGYQCEMEPAGMTGAIYDEGRRNRWVNVVTDELRERTRRPFRQGEWNELEIQAIGPSIRTWLNGEPVTDLMDTMTARGFFGLQVHSHNAPGQVRWRNIRIKELPWTPWIPFFKDGKFTGLEVKPAGQWKFLEDGTVHVTSTKDEQRDGMVRSTEEFDNFAVRVSFKRGSGNSSLYLRAHDTDTLHLLSGSRMVEDDHQTWMLWQVGSGQNNMWGLWEVGSGQNRGLGQNRGWVLRPPRENMQHFSLTEWNDLSVVAVGDRVVTILNGVQVVDAVALSRLKNGKTALQFHGGSDVEYWFRNYEIMPLSKELVELIER